MSSSRNGRVFYLLAVSLLLATAVAAALALGTNAAQGEEAAASPGPPAGLDQGIQPPLLTPQLIEEADHGHTAAGTSPEPDTEAAEELPHSGLDQGQALHLLTSVFTEAVEAPAGILDGIPAGKFIGTNAEILPPESVAELAEEGPGGQEGAAPSGPALIESAAPLRVEDEEGDLQPVDLASNMPKANSSRRTRSSRSASRTRSGKGSNWAKGESGSPSPAQPRAARRRASKGTRPSTPTCRKTPTSSSPRCRAVSRP